MDKINYKAIFNENLETLRDLLKIRSIYDETSVSKKTPYGKGVNDALLFMKNLAKKDGFIVKEYDHQAISISNVNKPNNRIDIASHLDVVAVDDKWSVDPFAATIKGDKIIGRGTSDMKTAGFLTYIALKMLKEKYPDTKNEIRLVFGTDEERTMNDMRHYRSLVSEPLFAFSPDGVFPMAIGEKGALMWTLSGKYKGEIEYLDGGIQCNIVSPSCKIILKDAKYLEAIQKYLKKHRINGQATFKDGKAVLETSGIATHSSRAFNGVNATIKALEVIGNVTNDLLALNLVSLFKPCFGEGFDSYHGKKFETCLTVNLGRLHIEDKVVSGQVDCRYPSAVKSKEITKLVKNKCLIKVSLDYDDPPTLNDLNDPYVKCLLDNYRNISKDMTKPIVSGGVSYSKVFKHCVTYGINTTFDPRVAHSVDEYVKISKCIKALKIYYNAMEKLAFLEEDQ